MSRYIDADKLFEKIGSIKPADKEHYKYVGEFMNFITYSPTADVIEVVRCKDCKHYCKWQMKCDRLHLVPIADNHYCSYGERREE